MNVREQIALQDVRYDLHADDGRETAELDGLALRAFASSLALQARVGRGSCA